MKKLTLLNLFILSILQVFVYACKKEEQVLMPVEMENPTIEELQNWFDKNLASQDVTTNAFGRTAAIVKRDPLWKYAKSIRLANGTHVVSVPLLYKKGYGLGKGSLTRLLFYKDKQGQYGVQIMKLISNEDYLIKNKGAINMRNYSGVIMLYDWKENFLSGTKYTNGKIVGELTEYEPIKGGRVAAACQEVRLEYYVDVCVGTNCSGLQFDYAKVYYMCGGGSSGTSDNISSSAVGEAVRYSGGGGSSSNEAARDVSEDRDRVAVERVNQRDIIIPGQNNPAIDLKEYFACFGPSQSPEHAYQITVYVQEPVPGTNYSASLTGNVGHTCIGFTKTDHYTSQTINQVIGFYPTNSPKALSLTAIDSKMVNNGDGVQTTPYTVSITYPVSAEGFQIAMQSAMEFANRPYDLDDNNCTDYVFNVLNKTGILIPQHKGEIIVSMGHNPGQLGYDLRLLKQSNPNLDIKTNRGNTPASKGPCI